MSYPFTGPKGASDESGKGDFFGGFCVCAAFVDEEMYHKLKENELFHKIDDSKKLNDSNIEKLATWLIETMGNYLSIVQITADKYNELYAKYGNLNVLVAYAHDKAWKGLVQQVGKKIEKRIIDQFCTKEKYVGYLRGMDIEPEDIDTFTTKADGEYQACAIASIVARYKYSQEINELSEKFKFKVPFGNSYEPGNSVVEVFRRIDREHGNAKNYCKNNFKTMERM